MLSGTTTSFVPGLMQKDSNRQMDLIKKYFDKSQWFFLLVRIGQGHSAQVVLCYQFQLIMHELIQRKMKDNNTSELIKEN
jgi:hypothetical protein